MWAYIVRRILFMIPTIIIISMISFVIIQLPPGDYVSQYAAQLLAQGTHASKEALAALRTRYGLEKPVYVQYWLWISGFPKGDFGASMTYSNAPVAVLIGNRLLLTMILSSITLTVAWGLAIPFGIYSAVHKNTIVDYILSFFSFIGLSIPAFLMALILMFISVFYFNARTVGGLFSPEYVDAPLTFWKIIDFFKHLPAPVIVLGLGGMAGTMRIMRGNLLDILGQQYIQTARAKGLKESVVIYKHAVRIAINPLISRLGIYLPILISGSIIVSIVLDLPTIGPVFYRALTGQDMYLAGTILLMLAVVLLLGNLLADIMLAVTDPRIRYD